MADLLVIVPSRGRPSHVARLWEAWKTTEHGGMAELLVCLDVDDPTIFDYPRSTPGLRYSLSARNGFAPRLSAEALAEAPSHFALASWGDDHVPRSDGWDLNLVEALATLGDGFAYGDDLFQGRELPTACAMTSSIVEALGWMTPPGLAHLYVDRFWRDMGEALDRIVYLPHVVIEHVHPAAGKAEWDDLTSEANTPAAYASDSRAYEEYLIDHFPADVARLIGEFT